MKTLLVSFLIAGAAVAGWFAAIHDWPAKLRGQAAAPPPTGRKVKFYQSAMHPWIKSDQAGKCTICGMDLVPVYEGETGFDSQPDLVALPASSVSVLNVRTVPVRRATLQRTLRFAGTIDDDDTRHRVVSAYFKGRIETLHANYLGKVVNAGEPLMDIYSPDLLKAEREYVSAMNIYKSDVEAHKGARIKLRRLGLGDAQIDALPAKSPQESISQILAPISGTIVAKKVYAGQYVDEGAVLLEIADFSVMWMTFRAYEQDLPFLKAGQEVEITTPALPGRIFRAPIAFIDPNLDDATRTAKVRVQLDNARHELRHKPYAEARVTVSVAEVLQVPRLAVLSPGGMPVVFVDAGNHSYRRRAVTLGRLGDDAWEVTAGLKADERVVVAGNLLMDSQAQMNDAMQDGGAGVAPVTETVPPGVKPWPLETCPVTGEKLGSMGAPPVFVFEGQQVKLCCKACKPKFDAEPQKILAALKIPNP